VIKVGVIKDARDNLRMTIMYPLERRRVDE
jgi:hypothetical protein